MFARSYEFRHSNLLYLNFFTHNQLVHVDQKISKVSAENWPRCVSIFKIKILALDWKYFIIWGYKTLCCFGGIEPYLLCCCIIYIELRTNTNTDNRVHTILSLVRQFSCKVTSHWPRYCVVNQHLYSSQILDIGFLPLSSDS